ncbi:sigma factor-like helix-turn-helix DNA-binding protein [Paenibacillus elgii]|uniref:sigma factor-like helix-turn-helix DNA-binding protein n=1 Tax=Paenibacillus elgii TaxID=189691 RepID=UPI0034DB1E42
MTEDERFKLHDAMCNLTERKRQCFVLHIAFRFTMRQIAEELDLKKKTVQTNILRAKQKIEK